MRRMTDYDRRGFFRTAAMTLAAARLGFAGSGDVRSEAKPASFPATKPGAKTSFGPLKQVTRAS